MESKPDSEKNDVIVLDLLTQILIRVNSIEDMLCKHLRDDHGNEVLSLINARRAFDSQHNEALKAPLISRYHDISGLLNEVFGQKPPDPAEGSPEHF